MNRYLRVVSDLDKNSQNLIENTKDESNTAIYVSGKVAYAKNTSAMYKSIKSCHSDLSRSIENSVSAKRALLSFTAEDYKSFYNAPFLYQSIQGLIDSSVSGKRISGMLYLRNFNGYTSWSRKNIGVCADISLISGDSVTTRNTKLFNTKWI